MATIVFGFVFRNLPIIRVRSCSIQLEQGIAFIASGIQDVLYRGSLKIALHLVGPDYELFAMTSCIVSGKNAILDLG